MNKNINMGFSQQTFYFDQPPEQNLKKEVLAFIYSTIAGNDQVTLDQVANHFCMQSDRWTKSLIRNLVNDLFRDDQIQFIIAETKFSSEKIKNLLSEPGQSLAKFKQIRNNLSTLKTHLSESAQWKYIEIIKPEVVEKSVLIQAQHLGKKLFKQTVSMNQNKLCQNLRKHLRMWRSDLEEFKKVSETGNYPGTNEIQKGLDLLNKLLSVHDPCKFLETFLNNENRLCDAYSHFIILDNFYKHQIHSWNALVEAVEVFKPNRMLLEKDPDVGKALELLCKMLKDPKPYSMIKEISGLISVVKAANDPIVEKQITSEKALAVERLDKRIDKIAKLLDEKNVNDDIRNKALFPLQTSKRKIITAISIQSISDYLEHGLDQFDNTIEMLS
ncbi:MAG: hypothetical protein SWH54_00325 [Thermodesulfobacteriota bacterium]|nr:hypothetical protein [Thermodesulfobacteriota bacterium]